MNKEEKIIKMIDYIMEVERLQQDKILSTPLTDKEVISMIKKELERITKDEDK